MLPNNSGVLREKKKSCLALDSNDFSGWLVGGDVLGGGVVLNCALLGLRVMLLLRTQAAPVRPLAFYCWL
jgi:hypothetical protein